MITAGPLSAFPLFTQMHYPPQGAILPSNVDTIDTVETAEHLDVHDRMRRELRSSAKWLVGLGLVNLFATGDPSWGLLLIAVGISSLWFRSASMFVVYTTAITWAAITNIIGGAKDGGASTGWLIFGVVQLYLAFQTFRDFRAFSSVTRALDVPDRARRLFPIASAVLGLIGLLGMLASVVAISEHLHDGAPEPPGLLVGLAMDAAILAFGLALSSLLSRYGLLVLSLVGLVRRPGRPLRPASPLLLDS